MPFEWSAAMRSITCLACLAASAWVLKSLMFDQRGHGFARRVSHWPTSDEDEDWEWEDYEEIAPWCEYRKFPWSSRLINYNELPPEAWMDQVLWDSRWLCRFLNLCRKPRHGRSFPHTIFNQYLSARLSMPPNIAPLIFEFITGVEGSELGAPVFFRESHVRTEEQEEAVRIQRQIRRQEEEEIVRCKMAGLIWEEEQIRRQEERRRRADHN